MGLKVGELRTKCKKWDIVISYHAILIILGLALVFGWLDELLGVF